MDKPWPSPGRSRQGGLVRAREGRGHKASSEQSEWSSNAVVLKRSDPQDERIDGLEELFAQGRKKVLQIVGLGGRQNAELGVRNGEGGMGKAVG
jgi:hypothetical protein